MNCESKICVLENVQTVFMSYQSVRKQFWPVFFFVFLQVSCYSWLDN